MVITRAHAQLGLRGDDESYECFARKIADLVEDGELEAVGDVFKRHYSEVRLMPISPPRSLNSEANTRQLSTQNGL